MMMYGIAQQPVQHAIPVDSTYPVQLRFKIRDGQQVTVGVEYTWKPNSCSHCKVFGHTLAKCPKQVPRAVPSITPIGPNNDFVPRQARPAPDTILSNNVGNTWIPVGRRHVSLDSTVVGPGRVEVRVATVNTAAEIPVQEEGPNQQEIVPFMSNEVIAIGNRFNLLSDEYGEEEGHEEVNELDNPGVAPLTEVPKDFNLAIDQQILVQPHGITFSDMLSTELVNHGSLEIAIDCNSEVYQDVHDNFITQRPSEVSHEVNEEQDNDISIHEGIDEDPILCICEDDPDDPEIFTKEKLSQEENYNSGNDDPLSERDYFSDHEYKERSPITTDVVKSRGIAEGMVCRYSRKSYLHSKF
ncbi:hypothetical protein IFM89_017691 [Coptis chinensis]|uniref:Zinc knuckle CX2CX4HX4C domain-containing protein n=1 Tax=Coptis chinensis TaxID=261450 RepID=A0A835M3P7_9MAGN|nr:hypothetical protein IFM89_017691 [Coptis chinensis]